MPNAKSTPKRASTSHVKTTVQLSELENAVLGVFWRRGPCSAYAVQQNFRPISAGWSASPGSVYPLINKLHRLNLISKAESEQRGKRTIQRYVITASGRVVLQRWVGSFPDWAGLPPADAIRTRSFFLDAVNIADQRAFLNEAETCTRAALAQFHADSETFDKSSAERLARLGGIYHLQARLRWLRAVRKEIGFDPA